MTTKCYYDEDQLVLEAENRGLGYVTTGGRDNKPIFYEPECENVVFTSSRGGAYQYGGNVLVFDGGNVYLIEGEIVEEESASVHGCWKVKKHQHAYRIRKIENTNPYIFYNYSICSWECLSCLLIENGKILYEELSERIGHKGIVVYPHDSVIIPNGIITNDGILKVTNHDLKTIKNLFKLGLAVLLIVDKFNMAHVPEIKTNIKY